MINATGSNASNKSNIRLLGSFRRGFAKMRKTPPPSFAHLGAPTWKGLLMCWTERKRFWVRLLIFASLKFFSFCREAKFGEFRSTLPAQVVCGSPVGALG
jgi:hypothetical protein